MSKAQPTMQDVADAARVSRACVCYALRNDPRLPEGTRRRIQAVARRLRYRPNPLVSALMTNLAAIRPRPFSAAIAYLTDLDSDPAFRAHAYHRAYFAGACQRAEGAGYRVEPFLFLKPDLAPPRLCRVLRARGIRGVLLVSCHSGAADLGLDWDQFAGVNIGMSRIHAPFHRVDADQYRSLLSALGRLRGLGYRRIGFVISRPSDEMLNGIWSAAYATFQAGLPARQRIPALSPPQVSVERFRAWFRRHHPDVVVGHGADFRRWIVDLGCRVPAEVGYFDIDLPPQDREMSGLNQRQDLIGAAAVDLIIEQLQRNELGIPAHPKQVLLESEWVQGRTIRKG